MQDGEAKPTTTDAGIPVASDEHSLTLGADGPILLQDHYLIEHRRPLHDHCSEGSNLR